MRTIKLIAENGKLLPVKAGIYKLLNAKREVIYIGAGQDLRHRVSAHYQKNGVAEGFEKRRDSEAKFVTFTPVKKSALLIAEAEAIRKNGGTRFNRYHGNKKRK